MKLFPAALAVAASFVVGVALPVDGGYRSILCA